MPARCSGACWHCSPSRVRGRDSLARAGRRVLYFTASTCGATVGASLLTTPLVALYFDAVPLISPLSNLLTLWAVGLLFGAGLCLGTLGLLPAPAGPPWGQSRRLCWPGIWTA